MEIISPSQVSSVGKPDAGIACYNCGCAYPGEGAPYVCLTCGGVYDFSTILPFSPGKVDNSQLGIWRYRYMFGLPANAEIISLGEGNTPLIWVEAFGRKVAFKCEYQNPSGSFKDRGSAVITAWLKARGIKEAVEDSSGNAGASFAAYAARAGIKTRIFIPASASGSKRKQIEAYGAELIPIPGSRSDVTREVKKAADRGAVYASHAYLPFNIPGYATVAYEIFEQLGNRLPGAVIVPAGQGGLLLGLARGFDTLRITNHITHAVKLIGVQVRACAPLWAMFTTGGEKLEFVAENHTLAEGVKVSHPVRGDAVLAAVAGCNGAFVAVDESEILPGREALAHFGLYVEPTSAIVWSALGQVIDRIPDTVVVMLTGSGLKWSG